MKQRSITELEIEYILTYPNQIRNTFKGRMEAIGEVNNRRIKIELIKKDNYIKIITLM